MNEEEYNNAAILCEDETDNIDSDNEYDSSPTEESIKFSQNPNGINELVNTVIENHTIFYDKSKSYFGVSKKTMK